MKKTTFSRTPALLLTCLVLVSCQPKSEFSPPAVPANKDTQTADESGSGDGSGQQGAETDGSPTSSPSADDLAKNYRFRIFKKSLNRPDANSPRTVSPEDDLVLERVDLLPAGNTGENNFKQSDSPIQKNSSGSVDSMTVRIHSLCRLGSQSLERTLAFTDQSKIQIASFLPLEFLVTDQFFECHFDAALERDEKEPVVHRLGAYRIQPTPFIKPAIVVWPDHNPVSQAIPIIRTSQLSELSLVGGNNIAKLAIGCTSAGTGETLFQKFHTSENGNNLTFDKATFLKVIAAGAEVKSHPVQICRIWTVNKGGETHGSNYFYMVFDATIDYQANHELLFPSAHGYNHGRLTLWKTRWTNPFMSPVTVSVQKEFATDSHYSVTFQIYALPRVEYSNGIIHRRCYYEGESKQLMANFATSRLRAESVGGSLIASTATSNIHVLAPGEGIQVNYFTSAQFSCAAPPLNATPFMQNHAIYWDRPELIDVSLHTTDGKKMSVGFFGLKGNLSATGYGYHHEFAPRVPQKPSHNCHPDINNPPPVSATCT
ncbi:MAG: hypothetical protein COT74_10120 [Bdellovibrionales bacterium CG10_big_fil_rev_8_21_14_0_10_45_34]|nr:MAG: hypothetical protein COT74_10120 [Bdellovibrionales bacterium CG10_big_fil_rev_8_21_14_0_10_45_34]